MEKYLYVKLITLCGCAKGVYIPKPLPWDIKVPISYRIYNPPSGTWVVPRSEGTTYSVRTFTLHSLLQEDVFVAEYHEKPE